MQFFLFSRRKNKILSPEKLYFVDDKILRISTIKIFYKFYIISIKKILILDFVKNNFYNLQVYSQYIFKMELTNDRTD